MPEPIDFLTAGGYGLAGVGGLLQGFEIQDAYSYNAGILENQADQVIGASNLEIDKIGRQEDIFLGRQQALYAKAGVTQSGSPTDVALQTATNFEFDKLVAGYNAKVKANYLESQAANQKFYGKVAANEGIAALGRGLLSAGLSFGGASKKVTK